MVGVSLATAGCATTTKLPLCPAIAEKSYGAGGGGKTVNYFTKQAADSRKIEIVELSAFVAEMKGSANDVDWLSQRYPHFMCAFLPRLEVNDQQVYTTCMRRASEWIKSVQSAQPETLFLPSS